MQVDFSGYRADFAFMGVDEDYFVTDYQTPFGNPVCLPNVKNEHRGHRGYTK
jgi:hypothetical protein